MKKCIRHFEIIYTECFKFTNNSPLFVQILWKVHLHSLIYFFLTEKPLFDEETCSSDYSFWNLDQTQTYTCNGQTDASVTVPEPGKLKNIFLEVLL